MEMNFFFLNFISYQNHMEITWNSLNVCDLVNEMVRRSLM